MIDYDHKKYGYKYDRMNRLQTLILPGNEKIGYDYDVLSNLTKVSYPNNTYSAYTFNDMNRLAKISTMKKGRFKDTFISEFGYSYDEVGNRASMEERRLFGKLLKTSYSYDVLYRLSTVSYPNHIDEAYTYDLSDNRTVCETKKIKYVSCFAGWKWDEKACKNFVHCIFHPEYVTYIVKYDYDKANKLLGLKETKKIHDKELLERTVAYEFDRNGNQVKESTFHEGCGKPVVDSFGYDYDNRLTSAVIKGIKKYEFTYNGAGKRVRTVVGDAKKHEEHGAARCASHSDAKETVHLYDGGSVIMDLDSRGKVVASYACGLGLRAITSNALKGFYHADALGSITEITGKEGQAIRSYRYSAWGDQISGENSHDSNPFRYVGAYGVRWQDSTLGLYHMGARHYDPRIGRFLQSDPIERYLSYIYCEGNPILYIDPNGYATSTNAWFTSKEDPNGRIHLETDVNYDSKSGKFWLKVKVKNKCKHTIRVALGIPEATQISPVSNLDLADSVSAGSTIGTFPIKPGGEREMRIFIEGVVTEPGKETFFWGKFVMSGAIVVIEGQNIDWPFPSATGQFEVWDK